MFYSQVCGSRLDPDYFVKTILERFGVMTFLTLNESSSSQPPLVLNPENQLPMLEGALTLLAMIVSNRMQIGKGT